MCLIWIGAFHFTVPLGSSVSQHIKIQHQPLALTALTAKSQSPPSDTITWEMAVAGGKEKQFTAV